MATTHTQNWRRVSSRETRTASGVIREHLNKLYTRDANWPPVLVGGELIGFAATREAALDCAESWTGVYGDDLQVFPVMNEDRAVAYILV